MQELYDNPVVCSDGFTYSFGTYQNLLRWAHTHPGLELGQIMSPMVSHFVCPCSRAH
jgi:hypothetical protein